MAPQPFGPWPLFQFLYLYTVGTTPWTGDQPDAGPLPAHRTTQTRNKHAQTSMSLLGFEPTIPVFEWAKTVHALDNAATVIGFNSYLLTERGRQHFQDGISGGTYRRFDSKIYNRSETMRKTTRNCSIDKDECTSLARLHCCHSIKAKCVSALCHYYYSSAVLVGPWPIFQFLDPAHRR
jgi:hypothetical protein